MARQKQCEQLCRVCTPSVFFLRLDRGNLGISHLINRWWKTVLHWELGQHSAVCVWSPPAVLSVPQSMGWPPSGTLMAVLLRSPQPDTLGIQPCLQCCSSREELRSQNQRVTPLHYSPYLHSHKGMPVWDVDPKGKKVFRGSFSRDI